MENNYSDEYKNGHSGGLKELEIFEDTSSTVYHNLRKIFEHLGVDNPKLVNKYKEYTMGECASLEGGS